MFSKLLIMKNMTKMYQAKDNLSGSTDIIKDCLTKDQMQEALKDNPYKLELPELIKDPLSEFKKKI